MNVMIKRRSERARPKNERQIAFVDIGTQRRAQAILNQEHFSFRVSSLSLYVLDSQEYRVLGTLSKAGIKPIEPKVKQVPICEDCGEEVNIEWVGEGKYYHKECCPDILPGIIKSLQST